MTEEVWALRSKRVLLPEGESEAVIWVRGERIEEVILGHEVPSDSTVIDVGGLLVQPGIVDTHAHINEPGRTEWEGFETATRAAACGGITTVVDMPLNSIPPTTTIAGLREKQRACGGKLHVDVGLWGGVVPGNSNELEPMVDAGALGFKAFLIESGVEEFEFSREADLRQAMRILADLGVPLLAHAELESAAPSCVGRDYTSYLHSRPRAWENHAVDLLIRLCRETRCRTHIVHLSSSDALEAIERAKSDGLPLTAETCPHYLTFTSEEIAAGATQYKCAPPIRERENRERLWDGLKRGVIDFVVSDHSPCTPALKRMEEGDFAQAWGGISSLQLAGSVIWTEASARGFLPRDLSRWMSRNTAEFAGLGSKKGRISRGFDADWRIWDPDATTVVFANHLKHRHSLTPYLGRPLKGRVHQTYLRGKKIFDDGVAADECQGRLL